MPHACHQPSPCVPANPPPLSPSAGRWRVEANPPVAAARASACRRFAARARADGRAESRAEGRAAAKAAPRVLRPRLPP
eukprot:scaffold94008_cov38-Phaeocystis_antarctica.AAC.2